MYRSRRQLDWVSTPGKALDRVSSGEFQVYLLDYRLGEKDGIELLSNDLAVLPDHYSLFGLHHRGPDILGKFGSRIHLMPNILQKKYM